MRPKIGEADFIRLFNEIGPAKLADKVKLPLSGVMRRRRNIEQKHGIVLTAPGQNRFHEKFQAESIPGRLSMAVNNGVVLVGSDLHAWPGKTTTAFRGFIRFIKEMEPKAIVMNGDVIDGASISRHPPLGWDRRPTLIEEIEAAQQALHEIELSAPRKTELIWPAGNHDARFSVRLATHAPEYAQVHGTKLEDHFGNRWKPCGAIWINDGEAVVMHQFPKSGVHASYNNTLHGGVTTVMGHTHTLNVIPYTDYKKTRWGVNCGMLADPYGDQFGYLLGGYRNWRAGFAVLTFRDSELLWPELAAVRGPDEIEFRGKVMRV